MLSVDCGQSFRWKKTGENEVSGVAFGKALTFSQTPETVTFYGVDGDDFEKIWVPYFDLERDYGAICKRFESDFYLKN
jgi:N-glycosylase/DNA lyase